MYQRTLSFQKTEERVRFPYLKLIFANFVSLFMLFKGRKMIERENVKFLKLVSTEEIIAEVQDMGDSLTLKNPVVISLRDMGAGKVGLSMPPWINLSASDKFPVAKSHVITMGTPIDDLLDAYIQAHSSIVVPNSGKLVV